MEDYRIKHLDERNPNNRIEVIFPNTSFTDKQIIRAAQKIKGRRAMAWDCINE